MIGHPEIAARIQDVAERGRAVVVAVGAVGAHVVGMQAVKIVFFVLADMLAVLEGAWQVGGVGCNTELAGKAVGDGERRWACRGPLDG